MNNKYEIGWNGLSFKIPENLILNGNLIINDKEIIDSEGKFKTYKESIVYHFVLQNKKLTNKNGKINYELLNINKFNNRYFLYLNTNILTDLIYNHPENIPPGYLISLNGNKLANITGINYNIITQSHSNFAIRLIVEIHSNNNNTYQIKNTLKKIGISKLITNYNNNNYSELFWIKNNKISDIDTNFLYNYMINDIGILNNQTYE